jgi:hypothetical protein
MRILTGMPALALATLIAAALMLSSPAARAQDDFGRSAAAAKKPAALDDGPAAAAPTPAPAAAIQLNTPPQAPLTMPAPKKQNAESFGPPLPPIPAAPAAEASDIIGTVVQVEGPVTIKAAIDGKETKAADKAPVHLHDVIGTGEKARALILLIDNSHVTIGEKAAFTADTFMFDPDTHAGNRIKLSFPQGTFKYAGSEVEKEPRTDIWLILPTGSAQVHGATLWGGASPDGYSVFVLSGDISISTGRGRVTVRQGQGTSMRDVRDTPSRPDAWPPERITAMIAETQISNAKDASAKMEQARHGQRALIARFKAWQALHPGSNSAGATARGPTFSKAIRPQPGGFVPAK